MPVGTNCRKLLLSGKAVQYQSDRNNILQLSSKVNQRCLDDVYRSASFSTSSSEAPSGSAKRSAYKIIVRHEEAPKNKLGLANNAIQDHINTLPARRKYS